MVLARAFFNGLLFDFLLEGMNKLGEEMEMNYEEKWMVYKIGAGIKIIENWLCQLWYQTTPSHGPLFILITGKLKKKRKEYILYNCIMWWGAIILKWMAPQRDKYVSCIFNEKYRTMCVWQLSFNHVIWPIKNSNLLHKTSTHPL